MLNLERKGSLQRSLCFEGTKTSYYSISIQAKKKKTAMYLNKMIRNYDLSSRISLIAIQLTKEPITH